MEIPERLQSGHRGCEAVGGRLLAVGNAVGPRVGVLECLWGRVRAGVLGGRGVTPPPPSLKRFPALPPSHSPNQQMEMGSGEVLVCQLVWRGRRSGSLLVLVWVSGCVAFRQHAPVISTVHKPPTPHSRLPKPSLPPVACGKRWN